MMFGNKKNKTLVRSIQVPQHGLESFVILLMDACSGTSRHIASF